MFWEVMRVPKPNTLSEDGIALSRWTGVEIAKGSPALAGTHYVINEEALSSHPYDVVLSDTAALTKRFRHDWVLRRAFRPYVLQPDSTPMPDRAPNHEERSKLYSVYLRPWVLERKDASASVPHITDLSLVPASHICARTMCVNAPGDAFVFRRLRAKTTTLWKEALR